MKIRIGSRDSVLAVIQSRMVMRAIAECYEKPVDPDMPKRVEDIYLAFEVFFGITDFNENIINSMRESVAYFRELVKKDGETVEKWL